MTEGVFWGKLTPEGEAERDRLQRELQKVIDVAHKHGWNGVENSKLLAQFLDDALGADKAPNDNVTHLPLREATQYTADGIRHLPPVTERVESGPAQFGDDWPGVFIRGDNAAYYVLTLAQVASRIEDPLERVVVADLQKLLGSAIVGPAGTLLRNGQFGTAPTPTLRVVRPGNNKDSEGNDS